MADFLRQLRCVSEEKSYALKKLAGIALKYSTFSIMMVFVGFMFSFYLYPSNLPMIPEPGRLIKAIERAVHGDTGEFRLFLAKDMNARLSDERIDEFFEDFIGAHPARVEDEQASVGSYRLPPNRFFELHLVHPSLNNSIIAIKLDATGRIVGLRGLSSVGPNL